MRGGEEGWYEGPMVVSVFDVVSDAKNVGEMREGAHTILTA